MSDHVASEQNGSNFLGTIATEQQVDEIGEGTDQLLRSPPQSHQIPPNSPPKTPPSPPPDSPWAPQGPRPKPARTRCRSGRECADRPKHLSWGHLPRPGCVRGGKSSEGHRIGVKRMFLHQKPEILLVRYRRRRPIAQNSDGCPNVAVLKLRIYCRKQCPILLFL